MNILTKNYPILLIIASMGPYLSLSLGLKLDNLIIYPLSILFSFYVLNTKKITMNRSVLGIFILWLTSTIYMITRTLILGGQLSTYSFVAEIKNLTQPLAIILLFLVIIITKNKHDVAEIIKKTSWVLLFMLSLNSLWTLLGFFMNLELINQHFWGGENSVASNAVGNGRFSGVFNQPVEAGIAYAAGLLVWIYLVEKEYLKRNLPSIIFLLLIIVGGTLTVSKVFVVVGIVMFILSASTVKKIRRKILPFVLIFTAIGYPIYIYLTKTWDGLNYLFRLFDISNYQAEGFLVLMTAGRFGAEDSSQVKFFERVWETSPLVGQGLGSQETYDSAYFHFFSSGGILGLFIYLVLLLTIGWLIFETYQYKGLNAETKLFLGLFVLIIVGGLGAPILTINRSSVIIWVFVGLLLQYLCTVKTERIKTIKAINAT